METCNKYLHPCPSCISKRYSPDSRVSTSYSRVPFIHGTVHMDLLFIYRIVEKRKSKLVGKVVVMEKKKKKVDCRGMQS